MTDASMPTEHVDAECVHVLERVYAFIDNELDTANGEQIRQHLAACEPCLDKYDVEQAVKSLVSRHCGGDVAPSHLRSKVLGQIAQAQTEAKRSI